MGAEFVIAVDISAVPEGNPTGDAARMLMQTFAIMGRSIKAYELRDADLVLQPTLAGVVGRRLHDPASSRSRPAATWRSPTSPSCASGSPPRAGSDAPQASSRQARAEQRGKAEHRQHADLEAEEQHRRRGRRSPPTTTSKRPPTPAGQSTW